MTTLGRNAVANIAAAGFTGVLTLAAAPLLLRWLGADAYGLVGLHTTLQGLMLLLDLGLSIAINREIAWLTASSETASQTRSVMRTALPFYFAIAIAFAAVMIAAAPWIASHWLDDVTLLRATVVDALRLMAIALAAHLVSLAYMAGFLGLQRQVLYSGLWSLGTAVRICGSAAIAFATRDVRAFFIVQAATTLLYVFTLVVALHRVMPPGRAEVRPELLRRAWQLARGVAIIAILGAITMHADKLAVSRSVPLPIFGHYSIAALLALVTIGGVTPLANAAFPRFAQLLRLENHAELLRTYHQTLQTVAALVLPIAAVLCVWSYEVLFVWTGQRTVAASQSGIAVLLVAGMAMYGLFTIPYMLQLAHGWTMPTIAMNAIGVLTFVPAMFVAAAKSGPFATAAVFASMHAAFLLCGLIVTHWRLLHDAGWTFVRDVGPALVASLVITFGGRLALPQNADRATTAALIAIVGTLAFLTAAAVTPAIRQWIRQRSAS